MRAVKYLRIILDSKLSFTRHIRVVSMSAAALARAIGKLMPNVGGPSMAKRRLLAAVVSSRLLYAASAWATRATKFKCNLAWLGNAQRLEEVLPCYRTVFTAAALFLAEMPLVDLLALERETVRRNRMSAEGVVIMTDARAVTMVAWQHW